MAISLKDLKKETANDAPRILIYGPEGLGKTTLASQFPKPVFLQIEKGTPSGLTIESFGHLKDFDSVLDALEALYNEDHEFKTVVVDSVSELERLIFAEVCKRNNYQTIETPGYGRGYKEADYVWQEFIDRVNGLRNEKKMAAVLIGHSDIKRFDDPSSQSYSRYQLSLHDRAAALLAREVDAILLIKHDVTIKADGAGKAEKGARVRGDGGETRWIYTEQRPAFMAKNRYSMPPKLIFEKAKGFDAISEYLPVIGKPKKKEAA